LEALREAACLGAAALDRDGFREFGNPNAMKAYLESLAKHQRGKAKAK
jgi:hypothetical protein